MSQQQQPSTERKRTRVAENRKARHDFEILDKLETGIALTGTEVKSVRGGSMSLAESYVRVTNSELWLEGCHIAPYQQASVENHDPTRRRKLLAKRNEIEKLAKRVEEKGLTLVPLAAYFSGRYLKIEVGVARGRKTYDKRHAIKEKETKRRMKREGV